MKFTKIDKLVLSSPILVIIGYALPFLSSNTPINFERIITLLIGCIFWIFVYFIIKFIFLTFKEDKRNTTSEIINQKNNNLQNDEDFYEKASVEFNSENRKEGLWTKVLVESDGDENKAKIKYIKIRVEQLINNEKKVENETKTQPTDNQQSKNFKNTNVTSFNGLIILFVLIICWLIFLILEKEGFFNNPL